MGDRVCPCTPCKRRTLFCLRDPCSRLPTGAHHRATDIAQLSLPGSRSASTRIASDRPVSVPSLDMRFAPQRKQSGAVPISDPVLGSEDRSLDCGSPSAKQTTSRQFRGGCATQYDRFRSIGQIGPIGTIRITPCSEIRHPAFVTGDDRFSRSEKRSRPRWPAGFSFPRRWISTDRALNLRPL